MEEKILVTGGTGLVGRQFQGDEYLTLSSSQYDLRQEAQVEAMFAQQKFDAIIHTAAKVGGVGSNMNYKGAFYYDNIMMNTLLIEQARRNGIKKLVAFLSTCVFPDTVTYPLTENKIHQGPPHFSNDAYAYAKRMVDVQIRAYREQYGLNYTAIIPTNIYGPGDNFDIENGHVVPSLIHKCFIARETKKNLEVWGTGKPLREFIFSADVAQLSRWALDHYRDQEPIIISTSEETSVQDLVGMVTELMCFKGEVVWNTQKPDGQFRKTSDNSKLKSYLPSYQFTSLYQGLKETIQWFEDNYQTVRGKINLPLSH